MSFDRICLNHLVYNAEYLKKVLPYLKGEYFEDNAEREVFEQVKTFVGKYNTAPTKEALAIMFSDMNMGEVLYDQVLTVVEEIEPDHSDSTWMFESTEKWAQDRAIYIAVSQAIGILDGKDKKLDKNAIPGLLTAALATSFDSHIGHDYFDSAEAQFEYYHNEESKFRSHLEIMNRVTKGGIPNKTLNVVQAGINVGKTTWLIDTAAHALSMGKNVIYFTAEVAEEVIRERADTRLMDITFDDLHKLDKKTYLGNVQGIRAKTEGQFVVKEFPTGVAHVGHFRHVLQELRIKKGFIPDMIVIDYLTICASSILSGKEKGNSNTYFTSVAEEFRTLAKEFNCILWTAAQFNRSGQTSENHDLTDVGLALGIAATADFMLALASPEEMAKENKIIGKVLKNRYANKAKIGKFLMGVDQDKQSFYDLSSDQQSQVMDADELAAFNKQRVANPTSEQGVQGWSFT